MAELTLSRQRCFHHAGREAAARCTKCLRYFCRECVIEYDNRLVCATCLESLARTSGRSRVRFAALRPWLAAAAGFGVVWVIFYTLGLMLVTMPSFGDAGVWGSR
jgi:hypothetical protein